MALVKFLTDSDGPLREVYINPGEVCTVEQSVSRPETESHITLMDERVFRVKVSAAVAAKQLYPLG